MSKYYFFIFPYPCPDLYTSIHPEPCQNNNYLYSHTPALIYTPQFILNHVKIIITYIPIPCPDLYTSIHPKPCQNITYLYSHTLPWSIHLNPSWTMSKYYLFIFPYPALICTPQYKICTPQFVLNNIKITIIHVYHTSLQWISENFLI